MKLPARVWRHIVVSQLQVQVPKRVFNRGPSSVALSLFACSWKRETCYPWKKEVNCCLGHTHLLQCAAYTSHDISRTLSRSEVCEDMATDIAPQIQHSKLSSWSSGKTSPPATSSTSLSCALESSMKMWQVSKNKKIISL